MNSLLHLLNVLLLCGSALGLTADDLAAVERELQAVISGEGILAAVRLSFHDCVGGCDGCLNIDNPDNFGLEDIVADLDTLYTENNYSELLSRADLWAYAGYVALGKAVDSANTDCTDDCVPALGLVFKYGRVDCSTAPYTTADVGLPSPHYNYEGLMDFFATEFGFTADEVVALMGVHTLGGAETYNSGFDGDWVEGEPDKFNNKYYSIMIDAANSWKQRDVSEDSTPVIQWNADDDVGFMLNSDMAIYKEFNLAEDGVSSCTYDECLLTDSAATVQKYAASNADWIADFAPVYTKVVEHVDPSIILQDIVE